MELIVVVVLTLVAAAVMYAKMVAAEKKVKENESLERAIIAQENESKERDAGTLDGADIGATVDFLNRLSDKNRQD